ncbi:MAG: hypothetical protein RL193_413 [Actinomycetota bacterium]|jgi:hypothetical protein
MGRWQTPLWRFKLDFDYSLRIIKFSTVTLRVLTALGQGLNPTNINEGAINGHQAT